MLRIPLAIAAIALTAPAFAQTTPAPADPTTATAAPAATPAKADVSVGKKVVDGTGADVGTITAVTNGVAELSTDTHKVGVPIGSFAANGDKLAVAITKAQVDAQGAPAAGTPSTAATGAATASAASPATTTASAAPTGAPAAGAAATGGATAATPVTVAVGAKVNDSTGAPVGTVKAVNGNMVTVASETASAQLPKTAFAASGDALMIGLTAAQFETAAKAAGGAKKG